MSQLIKGRLPIMLRHFFPACFICFVSLAVSQDDNVPSSETPTKELSNDTDSKREQEDEKKEPEANDSERLTDAENPEDPDKPTDLTKTEEPAQPMPSVEVKEFKKRPLIRQLPHLGTISSPMIPGQPWHVHDLFRPRPQVVAAGQFDNQPPADAIVLFDGKDLTQWYHRGSDGELLAPLWNVENDTMEIAPNTGSLLSIESFGSIQLHIEWATPEHVRGDSQGRGNSGIKIMERFEIQVLDSYNNRTYADGQAASMYGQYPPLVNVSRPPGEWQSYDIFFEAPVFEEDQLVQPAKYSFTQQ